MSRKKDVSSNSLASKPQSTLNKKTIVAANKKQSIEQPTTTNSITTISPEERREMIAQTAYYIAEKRGFSTGNPLEDWLIAEKEVDQYLRHL